MGTKCTKRSSLELIGAFIGNVDVNNKEQQIRQLQIEINNLKNK